MNRIWAPGSPQSHGGVIRDNVTVASDGTVYIEVNGDLYEGSKRGISESSVWDSGKRTGGVLQTKDTYGPGSFETVMKIPSVNGVCSSLWLFNYIEEGGVIHNYEVDIELHGTVYPSHDGAVGSFRKALCSTWITPEETAAGSTHVYADVPNALNDGKFHTYRIDWHTGDDPRVEYFIDGVKVCTIRTTVPLNEMYVNVGCWFPKDWCGDPNFETDVMVVKSFKYTPFAGETAGTDNTVKVNANNSTYYAVPTAAANVPSGNLLANGGFDGTRTGEKYVWEIPSGATTNGGLTFTGTVKQTVELDAGALALKLKLTGSGAATVKLTYRSIVTGVTVTGTDSFNFTGGTNEFTFTPPDGCTAIDVEITSESGATLTSATLEV